MSADLIKIPYTGPALPDVTLVGLVVTPTDNAVYQAYDFEFAGVDRPVSFGIHVSNRLAARFIKAFQAGVLVKDAHVKTDIYGSTYVEFTFPVLGRRLNADLKRLGY